MNHWRKWQMAILGGVALAAVLALAAAGAGQAGKLWRWPKARSMWMPTQRERTTAARGRTRT